MKKQVVVIHGGDAFDTYQEYVSFLKRWNIDFTDYQNPRTGWKKTLGKALGTRYEVITPDMPNKINAKYAEWKIWFEKFVPHLRSGVVLVGHSLGGIFLAKYLSKNSFPKKIKATFLVAAPSNAPKRHPLADFVLKKSLAKFAVQGGSIVLYHSTDDQIVPLSNVQHYQKALPNAKVVIFKNRGHFNQKTFPELVRAIKKLP